MKEYLKSGEGTIPLIVLVILLYLYYSVLSERI